MDKVINFGIPHVGEQIFESLDTTTLIQCLSVSKTFKAFAENQQMINKWRGNEFDACRLGHTEIVKVLFRDSKVNVENWNMPRRTRVSKDRNLTPFLVACRNGHKDVVQLLLDHSESKSIDLNVKAAEGTNGFMFACLNGHTDVVQLLLDYSERQAIELNGNWEMTSFMCACLGGHQDVVKLLLK